MKSSSFLQWLEADISRHIRFKMSFDLSSRPIAVDFLRQGMMSQECGGFVSFEGWVRDYNDVKVGDVIEVYEMQETKRSL